jgi:thiol-disulfide isomerase/thioredoxin
MATRKFRKSRPRKTVRRRRASTAGKILPPLDVRSKKHLKEFERRIKQGNLTIILVWAPWCPHCHTMMPHFDAAAKSPNRSIQAVKVEETMLPAVNQILTNNINKQAKPLNVEGYPSIIVVDKKGNKVTDIEPVRDTKSMTNLMNNAGPLAEQAGLNKPNTSNQAIATSIKNSLKNNAININSNNMENVAALTGNVKNNSNQKNILANLGIEEQGLVSGEPQNMNINSPKNIDVGEDELKGSIASEPNKNKNIKLNSIPVNKLGNAGQNSKKPSIEPPQEAIAPSPLNTFNESKNQPSAPPSSLKKLSQEAEEVTSLAAPITPPNAVEDMETSENVESISNSLTPEQKVSGGGRRGGSLYSAMARTTYTLAPAAALLATAAMVMKGKHRKTHKKAKKSRKTHRRR